MDDGNAVAEQMGEELSAAGHLRLLRQVNIYRASSGLCGTHLFLAAGVNFSLSSAKH